MIGEEILTISFGENKTTMSEEKFEWNDELVKEFIRTNFNRQEHNYLPHAIKDFKKSKQNKDWEIVEIYKCDSFIGDQKTMMDYVLNHGYIIKSVKRLSDEEVFSVGDETNAGVIQSFYINKHDKMTFSAKGEISSSMGQYKLDEQIIKAKQIDLDKPVLSLKDIEAVFGNDLIRYHAYEINDRLKELVLQKNNQ
jgi:hypothetical protein